MLNVCPSLAIHQLSQPRHLQKVVSVEIFPILLPIDIHRNGQETYDDFDAAKDDEEVSDPDGEYPVECVVCQDEGEHVLEYQKVGECFHRNISVRVQQVLGRCYRSHDHADNDECEKYFWHKPAVPRDIIGRDAKAEQPNCCSHQCWDNKEYSKLGFIFAFVSSNHKIRYHLTVDAREEEPHNTSNERRSVHFAGFLLVEE